MKILVILAHPNLENSIANKLIINNISRLQNVEVRELIKLYPDFKIDIQTEQNALLEADIIIFQFPFYWYGVPAILKQWMDEIFNYGFAFGQRGSKLKNKDLICSITIGGPKESYTKAGSNNCTVEELLIPLKQTVKFTAMKWNNPILSFSMSPSKEDVDKFAKLKKNAQAHSLKLADVLVDLKSLKMTPVTH